MKRYWVTSWRKHQEGYRGLHPGAIPAINGLTFSAILADLFLSRPALIVTLAAVRYKLKGEEGIHAGEADKQVFYSPLLRDGQRYRRRTSLEV
jgi:hypothetical protein